MSRPHHRHVREGEGVRDEVNEPRLGAFGHPRD